MGARRRPAGTGDDDGASECHGAGARSRRCLPQASAVAGERVGGVEPYFPAGARLRSAARLVRTTLFGLSGLVLLVVGLNISGMMLARERDPRA